MAHQYSRVGFKSSVEVNEVNLSLSYDGVGNEGIAGSPMSASVPAGFKDGLSRI